MSGDPNDPIGMEPYSGSWWPTILAVCGLILSLAAGGYVVAKRSPDPQPAPSLADRINAACPAGWHVADWTAGDQFEPVPSGTVLVTCEDKTFHTRIVAVDR